MSQWIHTQTMRPVRAEFCESGRWRVSFPYWEETYSVVDFHAKFHRAEEKDDSPRREGDYRHKGDGRVGTFAYDTDLGVWYSDIPRMVSDSQFRREWDPMPLWDDKPGDWGNEELNRAAAGINSALKQALNGDPDDGKTAPGDWIHAPSYERGFEKGREDRRGIAPESCVIEQAELDRLRGIEKRLKEALKGEVESDPDGLMTELAHYNELRYIQTGEEG